MSRYRGETDSKKVSRVCVWSQHLRVLGRDFFDTPHAFLASRVAGDAETLLTMGVPALNIWAVDKDETEVNHLLKQNPDWRVFDLKVENVIEQHAVTSPIAPHGVRSVYLDFCGNLQGMAQPIRRVLAPLSANSVVSITLFLGREQTSLDEAREALLLRQIQEYTPHRVTLVQSVHYQSSSGKPMETWTFALGNIPSRSKMRFDLAGVDVSTLAASPSAIQAMWEEEKLRAERRSLGAVKANQSRRQPVVSV
jgi:hypothetical protein